MNQPTKSALERSPNILQAEIEKIRRQADALENLHRDLMLQNELGFGSARLYSPTQLHAIEVQLKRQLEESISKVTAMTRSCQSLTKAIRIKELSAEEARGVYGG